MVRSYLLEGILNLGAEFGGNSVKKGRTVGGRCRQRLVTIWEGALLQTPDYFTRGHAGDTLKVEVVPGGRARLAARTRERVRVQTILTREDGIMRTVWMMLCLVVVVGLCVAGCGKQPAAPVGPGPAPQQVVSPPTPAEPAAETQPTQPETEEAAQKVEEKATEEPSGPELTPPPEPQPAPAEEAEAAPAMPEQQPEQAEEPQPTEPQPQPEQPAPQPEQPEPEKPQAEMPQAPAEQPAAPVEEPAEPANEQPAQPANQE